jgi:peptidylprolyl isomerase
MAQAKQGDKVRIELVGTLEDGTVFQDSVGSQGCDDECGHEHAAEDACGCGGPLEVTIGAGELFPQLEELLIGMAPGEKRSVMIIAADAFGEYDDDHVVTIPLAQLPDDLHPEVGEELVLTGDDDEHFGVTVVEVNAESVTFDSNHPLAGEDLTFEVILREILS